MSKTKKRFYRAGKRFPGVYYRPLRHASLKDKTFYISYRSKSSHKQIMEKVGRESEGMTPEKARDIRNARIAASVDKKFERKKVLTFGQIFEKYIVAAKQEKKSWRTDLGTYRTWLEKPFGKMKMDEISPFHLNKLKKQMTDQGSAPRTVNKALQVVRHTYNWASQNQLYSGDNPATKVKFYKLDNARQRFLTPEEAVTLLEALKARSYQTYCIAYVSLLTGMRLGEVLNLSWNDIDFENNLIMVRDTKNGESRMIPISAPLKQLLSEIPVTGPKVFTHKGLSKSFYRTVRDLGFNEGIEDRRQRVSFHTLRHTYASWAVKAGLPLYNLSKALGQKTLAMTQRYAHLQPETLKPISDAVATIMEIQSSPKVVRLT